MSNLDFVQKILEFYPQIKEQKLTKRWIRFKDIEPLIETLKSNNLFENQLIGHSLQGREIYQLKFGHGNKKVLLWSQMHGNESTATMAFFDLFNCFSSDAYADWVRILSQELTLYFIPMLNPDGAEAFTRENSLGIDINRDAMTLQTPEAQLLMKICVDLKPDFAFNLHDQRRIFTTGIENKPATLSFLTPSFDSSKALDLNRKRSMHLIQQMNKVLQNFIADQIGRYDDSFYPRAFGDNIQKMGIPTILIESGWVADDWNKQEVRKWNFIGIVSALNLIVDGIDGTHFEPYFKIPENKDYLLDILIKNLVLKTNSKEIKFDIGINWIEKLDQNLQSINYHASIVGVGDLRYNRAYHEFDAEEAELLPLETSSKSISETIGLGKAPEFKFVNKKGQEIIFNSVLKQ